MECLQLLGNFNKQSIALINEEGIKEVKLRLEKEKKIRHVATIETTFLKTVFQNIAEVKNQETLQKKCVSQTLLALGVYGTKSNSENQNKKMYQIQLLVAKLYKQQLNDIIWQQFFSELDVLVWNPSFLSVSLDWLKDFEKMLKRLDVDTKKNKQITTSETLLEPIKLHIQCMKKTIQKGPSDARPMVIDQLQSAFEDTGSITVQNAGLVLLWPFLQRFFENVGLLNLKEFKDVDAQTKAACLLHYIVDNNEASLFEGALPLNKVLCSIPISDTIALQPLKEEDQVMIEGLLKAVIEKGPHWKNLSIAGFRNSYLQREGLLRSRDGHWLLQVKKETYDITLEKIPWGFSTVKLPWMNQILVVEWM